MLYGAYLEFDPHALDSNNLQDPINFFMFLCNEDIDI